MPVNNAIAAKAPPSAKEPVSPIITAAGWALNHVKPKQAPPRPPRIRQRREIRAYRAMTPIVNETTRSPRRPNRRPVRQVHGVARRDHGTTAKVTYTSRARKYR